MCLSRGGTASAKQTRGPATVSVSYFCTFSNLISSNSVRFHVFARRISCRMKTVIRSAFAVASTVSFATGSSWSTMSILLPNVVALAGALGEQTQLGVIGMVAISIGAVLDGAIFGDHCSPISDTTVLSSVASGSDHLDHVRTQAPYAFVTAALAVTCGYLPSVLLGWWSFPLALGCGALLVAALLAGLGRRLPDASPE